MSVLKMDYSNVEGFEAVKPGKYEVIVHNYAEKQSASGSNMFVVDYEIRNDVDQPYGGRKIMFDNFVATENSQWRFAALGKAVGLPEGTEFNSYKEWADMVLNKPLQVITGYREHNGQKYAQVKGFEKSQVAPPEAVKIDDSDVPF
ncbi:DUF669 domain-containing protein [Bacillus sp. FSL W7-1360]